MPLQSDLLSGDSKLEACLIFDSAHVVPGSRGDHVKKIQIALNRLSSGRENFNLTVDGVYGRLTAGAVKAYKSAPQRRILGPGQTAADDIVGKRTIKSLDDEMSILENQSPSTTGLISSDVFGSPHDHSKCALPSVDPEIEKAPDGTMSHIATPMNPLRFGRMINIGGVKETDYLGFKDAVPDPRLDPSMKSVPVKGRLLTSSLPAHSVSDICFRSAPLDQFMRTEIPRICARGARITFVDTTENSLGLMNYFRSIGVIIQSGRIIDKPGQPPNADRFFVIVTVLNVTP